MSKNKTFVVMREDKHIRSYVYLGAAINYIEKVGKYRGKNVTYTVLDSNGNIVYRTIFKRNGSSTYNELLGGVVNE